MIIHNVSICSCNECELIRAKAEIVKLNNYIEKLEKSESDLIKENLELNEKLKMVQNSFLNL